MQQCSSAVSWSLLFRFFLFKPSRGAAHTPLLAQAHAPHPEQSPVSIVSSHTGRLVGPLPLPSFLPTTPQKKTHSPTRRTTKPKSSFACAPSASHPLSFVSPLSSLPPKKNVARCALSAPTTTDRHTHTQTQKRTHTSSPTDTKPGCTPSLSKADHPTRSKNLGPRLHVSNLQVGTYSQGI